MGLLAVLLQLIQTGLDFLHLSLVLSVGVQIHQLLIEAQYPMSNIETRTTRISLTALVNIANVLGVSVDDLIYDSVVHARPQLEREIQQIVDSCDDYELRVVKEVTHSVVDALRANEKLKDNS